MAHEEEALVPQDPVVARLFGRIEGQLRELFHTKREDLQKQQAAEEILIKLKDMPANLELIKTRLDQLEKAEYRREGGMNLIAVILKSPALAWLMAIAVAAWIWLRGGSAPNG